MIYFETDYVGEVYDLEHPRILWNSISRRSSIAASTEAAGFEAVNAATATEWDEWKPTAMPATWTLTFDENEPISAVAIQKHTLGTSGTTVAIQERIGGVWTDIVSATPEDDEPIAFLFELRNEDRIRVSLSGATIPSIAVIHCSEALEIPQRVYMGAPTPIDMALVTEFDNNQSTDGQFLGRSIRVSKNENEFNIQHLTEYWVRETFMPFIKDAREYPYFLLERPYSRPTALSYRIRASDIRPERMGIKSLMQVAV